jgi:hypothetical protein
MKKLIKHDFVDIKRSFMKSFMPWLLFFACFDIFIGLLMIGFQIGEVAENAPFYILRVFDG